MSHITDKEVAEIENKACLVRESVIKMLTEAGSGHTAGSLGMADVFAAFYFHILKHRPDDPNWADRDRLILSNGHIVPVRYATMAHAGYLDVAEAEDTLRKFGSRLQGHPEPHRLPGLESSSGPLGSGLSQAAGIAYAARMDKKKFHTYCFMSDGEMQAGNIWEAAMFAGMNKLNNLTGLIDRNNIQINGMTENVVALEPLKDKWEAFGWHVLEVDGHNVEEIVEAANHAKAVYEKPVVIIANTIPGKGIPDIEFDYHWHGKSPNEKEEAKFLKEIRTCGGRVSGEYA